MSSHISTSHFVSAFAACSSILCMQHSQQQRLDVHSSLCCWECRIRKILLQAANADTKCDVEMCEDIFDPVIEKKNTWLGVYHLYYRITDVFTNFYITFCVSIYCS